MSTLLTESGRHHPIRHTVKAHRRRTPKTRRVIGIRSYERGRGKRSEVPSKTAVGSYFGGESPKSMGKAGGRTYRFVTQSERIVFAEDNMDKALITGLDRIRKTPREIRIRRVK